MKIRIIRGIEGHRILQIELGGRTLRAFFKPWYLAYGHRYLNMIVFGAGPIGCMYWPRKERA